MRNLRRLRTTELEDLAWGRNVRGFGAGRNSQGESI